MSTVKSYDSTCFHLQNKSCSGFTLLEVVVAVAIFAVIGLGSWQVLNQVITAKKQVEERSAQLRQLQKASWVISRDIHNIIDRSIRNETGEIEPAVSSLIAGYPLTLTRSGWDNPLNEVRSTLQRVAYSLEPNEQGGSSLIRYYWPVLDRLPTTEPYKQVLLSSVSYFDAQFIDIEGNSQFAWPINQSDTSEEQAQSTIPAGILIRIDTPPFGEFERLFALRDIEEPQQ